MCLLACAALRLCADGIPDVTVIDQDGTPRLFYSSLIQGKTVAVQFIFTTCNAICPPMAVTFRSVQRKLSKADAAGIELISVSVDPEHDTPQRLKAFADEHGRRPGWTLVTGERTAIEQILRHFQVLTQDKITHTAMLSIGNDNTGSWTRSYGLAPADSLVRVITELARKGGH